MCAILCDVSPATGCYGAQGRFGVVCETVRA